MALMVPGADTLSGYWQNIVGGVDCVTDPPPDWQPELFLDETGARPDRVYTGKGGYLGDLCRFDPVRYGVMPNSVDGAEPDQFIALRCAAEAFEDAGLGEIPLERASTGVILGRGTFVNRGFISLLEHGFVVDQALNVIQRLMPELGADQIDVLRAELKRHLPPSTAETAPGLAHSVLAGRIANRLDLHGPAYTLDAACASSLLAVEHGVEALRSGRCDAVLAGGVQVSTRALIHIIFCQLEALSKTGSIAPFSADANGTLLGEGCGMLVLKRRGDAERDGNRIYALIKSVGVSSDGRGGGLLAPRQDGQVLSIRRAFDLAGVSPSSVGLVEAHGTGIALGDRTEIASLTSVFGPRTTEQATVALGSVKSQIGHLIPASGSASLIKTALALHHRVLPPSLHADSVNPELGLDRTPFYVNGSARPWIHGEGEWPRRAMVDAFGFGGINACAVLEEYREGAAVAEVVPDGGSSVGDAQGSRGHCSRAVAHGGVVPDGGSSVGGAQDSRGHCSRAVAHGDVVPDGGGSVGDAAPRGLKPAARWAAWVDLERDWPGELVVVSAPDRRALAARCLGLADWLDQAEGVSLLDVAATLGSSVSGERVSIWATDAAELVRRLRHVADRLADEGRKRIQDRGGIFYYAERLAERGRVALVFPGEGAQYVGMLSELCRHFPEVCRQFDLTDRAFSDRPADQRPSRMVYPRAEEADEAERALLSMDGAVEAVATADRALLALLRRLGVEFDAVVGHSSGEFAALCAAGVIRVSDDAALVECIRAGRACTARIIESDQVPRAALLTVGGVEASVVGEVVRASDGAVVVAMDNCPHQVVLVGSEGAIEAALDGLRGRGGLCQVLPWDRAYHTEAFAPACEALKAFYASLDVGEAAVEVWSCSTAAPYPDGVEAVRDLAVRQWRTPVRFRETIEAMYEAGVRVFVEPGPRGNLSAFVADTLSGRAHAAIAMDVPRRGGIRQLCQAVGMLVAQGAGVDLSVLYAARGPRMLDFDAEPPAKVRRAPILRLDLPELVEDAEVAAAVRAAVRKGSVDGGSIAERAESRGEPLPDGRGSDTNVAPRGLKSAARWEEDDNGVEDVERAAGLGRAYAEFQETMRQFLRMQQRVMTEVMSGRREGGGHSDEKAQGDRGHCSRAVAHGGGSDQEAVPDGRGSVGNAAPRGLKSAARGDERSRGPKQAVGGDRASLLVGIVSERTGYPADMLDPEAALEADLGIDSIKRVEIIGAFRRAVLGEGEPSASLMEKLTGATTMREIVEAIDDGEGQAEDGTAGRADAGAPDVSGASGETEGSRGLKPAARGEGDGHSDEEAQRDRGHCSRAVAHGRGEALRDGRGSAGDVDRAAHEASRGLKPAARGDRASLDGSDAAGVSEGGRPFVDVILEHTPGARLVYECELVPDRDLFLLSHTLGREVSVFDPSLHALPVMPLAMTLELLVEGAVVLCPGRCVAAVSDVRTHGWLAFPGPSRRIRVTAVCEDDGRVRAVMTEADREGFSAKVAEAVVELCDAQPDPGEARVGPVRGRASRWLPDLLYTEGLFHGPAFRSVRSIDAWSAEGVEGRVARPDSVDLISPESDAGLVIPVSLIDGAGQLVGFWGAEHALRMGFPTGLYRLSFWGLAGDARESLTARARVREVDDGRTWVSDVELTDAAGRVRLRCEGRRDRVLPVPEVFWRYRVSPRSVVFSRAITEVFADLPGVEDLAVCALVDFPREVLLDANGFWRDVLAWLVLSRSERAWFSRLNLPPEDVLSHVSAKMVAKDAVRTLLEADVCMADVPVSGVACELAEVWVSGGGVARAQVSCAACGSMAVAVAGRRSMVGVGIDLIDSAAPVEDAPVVVASVRRAVVRALGMEGAEAARGVEVVEFERERGRWSVRLNGSTEAAACRLGVAVGDAPLVCSRVYDGHLISLCLFSV